MNKSAPRALVSETFELDANPDLLTLLPASNPLLWWRKGSGMVGLGHALTLEFSGPTRIADAASAWQEISAAATVTDPVDVPGSGLIAFGAISFADASAVPSVLVIPRVVIGHRDGRSWLTRIRFADESPTTGIIQVLTATTEVSAAALPAVTAVEHAAHVTLTSGAQSEAGFLDAVDQAVARIRSGAVSKVVLARDLIGHLNAEDDVRSAMVTLAHSYPDCWNYSVDGLIGASPETLVIVQENRASARVLAGTTNRGIDAQADVEAAAALASSPKDLDEHGFAVRSVVEALTPFTSHLIASDAPFTLKLPNLWHLATDISGSLTQGSTSLDLVQALHPTAAVAGTPTAAAVRVISELEPFDRGRYAGPVGWIGADGDGEWAIALRCAQVRGDQITAYAGCGIVADSIAEKELSETWMKFRPVLDALN